MRPIRELMTELREAQVRVWTDGLQVVHYRAPRGGLSPDLLAEVKTRKSEILDFIHQAKAGTETFPLAPVPRQWELQISQAQHRLWALEQLEGPSPTYNISMALRLRGALEVVAMRRSLEGLLQRHESLRTGFEVRGDAVRPIFVSRPDLPWAVIDLSHLPADEQLAEVRPGARREAKRPFDLSRPPLIRFMLWKLRADDHVLQISVHHIISDRRSIEVLADDLSAFYAAYCDDREPVLPELPVQFADFVWHQCRWFDDDARQDQLEYWKKQLAGLVPLLPLPIDRPRTPGLAREAGVVSCSLAASLVTELKNLARTSGVTLYATFLAAGAVLLSRYTGLDDIPIACPATNRNRAELERLVGFFVNAIVLRLDVSGSPTFRELLGQARMVLAEAVAHQDVPFDKVVEILRVERDPSYPPLAQVSMVMLDSESVRPKLNGLETDPFDFDNSTAHYDLSLEIYKQNGSIRIFWMYDARLFDADTVAQMAAHFEFLLEQIADSPDSRLADVSLLRESERQKVLALAAPSIPSHSAGQTLVGMFEEQAALAPNNVALIMPATAAGRRQTMSYRDLNARANRLAHYLRQLDVGPGVVVGVCLPRSLDLVIALFGILKAGGGIPSTGYDSPS